MEFLKDPYVVFFVRWLHVVSGVMWIGLLWYFNFVQIPSMPKIPDEQKPAISQGHRACGAVLVPLGGRVDRALRPDPGLAARLSGRRSRARPHQRQQIRHDHRHRHVARPDHGLQRLVHHLAESAEGPGHGRRCRPRKRPAARMAMLTSRFNTMLSIPMLYCMVAIAPVPADRRRGQQTKNGGACAPPFCCTRIAGRGQAIATSRAATRRPSSCSRL